MGCVCQVEMKRPGTAPTQRRSEAAMTWLLGLEKQKKNLLVKVKNPQKFINFFPIELGRKRTFALHMLKY